MPDWSHLEDISILEPLFCVCILLLTTVYIVDNKYFFETSSLSRCSEVSDICSK